MRQDNLLGAHLSVWHAASVLTRPEEYHDTGPEDNGSDAGAASFASAELEDLVRRIHKRLPDMCVPGFADVKPAAETAWKLRGLTTDFSEDDARGPLGHRWPASALTEGDRKRLTIVGNLTGVPNTKLLRRAVLILFEAMRHRMADLLEEPSAQPEEGGLRSSDPNSDAGMPGATTGEHGEEAAEPQAEPAPGPLSPEQPARIADEKQPVEDTVLAAEPGPQSVRRRQRTLF
jgi:hypothetical protein